MDNAHFTTFLQDVQSVFNMKISARQSEIWTKSFKDLDYELAERMINIYYTSPNSKDKPRPHELLEVKGLALAELQREGKATGPTESCKRCNNTGFLIVKRYLKNNRSLLDYAYKCFCEHGNLNGGMSLQVGIDEIQTEKHATRRYKVVSKRPLVLLDTQIWKGNYPTSEHLMADEINNLLLKEKGTSIDNVKMEEETAKLKQLFRGLT